MSICVAFLEQCSSLSRSPLGLSEIFSVRYKSVCLLCLLLEQTTLVCDSSSQSFTSQFKPQKSFSNPFSLYVFLPFKFQPSSDCMFMNILRKRYLSFVNISNTYCLFTHLPVSQSSCTVRRVSRSNASFMFSTAGSPRTCNKQFLIGGF